MTIVYNTMKTVVDGLPTAKYVLFSLFYALSILGIIFGIMGVMGAKKRNRCLLCLYTGVVVILTVLGVTVGVAGLIFFPEVFKGTTCASSNNNVLAPFIPTFNNLYTSAYSSFATASCPALYPSFATVYTPAQQTLLASDGFVTVTTATTNAFSSAISSCTQINNANAIALGSI